MANIDDAFAQFQTLIAEHMDPAVEDLQLESEDPMPQLIMSSRNLVKLGRISETAVTSLNPGYEARWNVKVQKGGLMFGADFGQTQLTMMGPDNALVMGVGANSLFGDPTTVPQPSYKELKSRLKKFRGMYTFNFERMEAAMLSQPIENLAADAVTDITDLVRNQMASLIWGPGTGLIGTLDEGAGANVAEGSIVWVSIKNSQVFRFVKGQRYFAASLTGSSPNAYRVGDGASATTPSIFRCVGVNPFTLKVGFESESGQGTIALTDGDGIFLNGMWNVAGGVSRAPNGLESLLINTGAFPDTADITDVTNWPELQAYITGNESAREAPEPEQLDAILDLLTAANSGLPPVLIAENSLWTLYSQLERRTNMMVPVAQGDPYTANGGIRAPMYSYQGQAFTRLSSTKCRPGTIWGLDPSSFIRFMPNDLNVRWRTAQGGIAGAQNIFRPVYVGTQLSDLMVAEFEGYMQIAVTRPNRNVKRIGFHNQRTYNAAA